MKQDFRIVGKPYRGTRRVMVMVSGFATREAAEARRAEGVAGGWLDPDSWVRSQKVRDAFVGVDHTAAIRASAG